MSESLDREAVQRILSRAQQLEDSGSEPAAQGVEPEALVAAASEVGIDPDAVRDSMAIERLSVSPPDRRRLDRVAGPQSVVIEREVSIGVDEVISGLEAWLTSLYRLSVARPSDARLRARRRTDTSARVGRRVAGWRGQGRLEGITSIDVEAVPQVIGSTPARPRTIVRIRADRHDARTLRLAGGGTAGVAGVGVGALTIAGGVAVAAPVVALPFLVSGYAIARTGRGQSDRLELQLERLVSMVATGERPRGVIEKALGRATKR